MKKVLAYIQLTKACNLKCSMCNFYENEYENFSLNHFKKLIDIMYEEGIKWITFWWGEPFLNKRIYDIVEYTYKRWIKVCIITNWTVLNEEKLLKMIPHLDEILISIDSWIPAVHDQIRWKQWSFIKAENFVKFLSENKTTDLNISIDTTIQKINFDTFHTIIDLALKYNLYINFDPVQLYWYWNNSDSNLKPNWDEINFIENKIRELKNKYPNVILQTEDSLDRIISYFKWVDIELPCKSLNKDLLLDPFGSVIECWGRNKVLYNIFKEGWIKDVKTCMSDDCKKCWFSHVREWDYDDWYSPLTLI